MLSVLSEGFASVAKSRNAISYSYVRLYGLRRDDTAKDLFRFSLNNIEDQTDSLQESLEKAASVASRDKLQSMVKQARVLSRLVDAFQASVAPTAAAATTSKAGSNDNETSSKKTVTEVAYEMVFPVKAPIQAPAGQPRSSLSNSTHDDCSTHPWTYIFINIIHVLYLAASAFRPAPAAPFGQPVFGQPAFGGGFGQPAFGGGFGFGGACVRLFVESCSLSHPLFQGLLRCVRCTVVAR